MEVAPTPPIQSQLGCGRNIDDIWDHIDDPPSPHESTCPDCQTARADLADLVTATRQLRTEDTHDLHANPQVIERILTIARSEIRRGRLLPLQPATASHPSDLNISEQAIATIIRRVGDANSTIQIRRCTVRTRHPDQQSSPAAQSSVAPVPDGQPLEKPKLHVGLRVSVDITTPILEQVDNLRAAIIYAVDHEVGMNISTIDIDVDDIND